MHLEHFYRNTDLNKQDVLHATQLLYITVVVVQYYQYWSHNWYISDHCSSSSGSSSNCPIRSSVTVDISRLSVPNSLGDHNAPHLAVAPPCILLHPAAPMYTQRANFESLSIWHHECTVARHRKITWCSDS